MGCFWRETLAIRRGRINDGGVVVMRSDLRRRADGLTFAAQDREIVRIAFLINAHAREIIAWKAVTGAGVSGLDIRDMALEAFEARFGDRRAPSNSWLATAPDDCKEYARHRDPTWPDALPHAGRQP